MCSYNIATFTKSYIHAKNTIGRNVTIKKDLNGSNKHFSKISIENNVFKVAFSGKKTLKKCQKVIKM